MKNPSPVKERLEQSAPHDAVSDVDSPEVSEEQVSSNATGEVATTVKSPTTVQVPKKSVEAAQAPFTLTDLNAVKVHPGSNSPKVGDTIYTFSNMPKDACGEYWVLSSDGHVGKIAVCAGDSEDGHGH